MTEMATTNVDNESVIALSEYQASDSQGAARENTPPIENMNKKKMLEEIKGLPKTTSPISLVKGEDRNETKVQNLESPSASVSAVGSITSEEDCNDSNPIKRLSNRYSKMKGKWPPIFNKEKRLPWPDLTRDHASIRLDVQNSGNILIRTVTWNQQAQDHPSCDELRDRLLTEDRYHVYAIGTQECEHSIAHSFVNQSKLQWEILLRETLGHNYDMIQSHTLQASNLIMFMHKALTPLITDISSFSVPCGVGNQLGNKGAIAISLSISSTSFLFINSHFASGQGAYQLRNLNYHRIQTELIRILQPEKNSLRRGSGKEGKVEINDRKRVYPIDESNSTKGIEKEGATPNLDEPDGAPKLQVTGTDSAEDSHHISYLGSIIQSIYKDPTLDPSSGTYDFHKPRRKLVDLFDHVFWFGDFNYRVNGSINTVLSLLKKDYHEVLLNNDQLRIAMRKGEAFHGFTEGPLNFRPTYKYKRKTDEYHLEKKRIPSWTDRILYKQDNSELLLYAAVRELSGSDHKPVMASFRTKVNLDIVPSSLTAVGNHKSEVCNIS